MEDYFKLGPVVQIVRRVNKADKAGIVGIYAPIKVTTTAGATKVKLVHVALIVIY